MQSNPNNSHSQAKFGPDGCLPGLEAQAILDESPAAARAGLRMDLGLRLASALVGHPLRLVDGKAGWSLVDGVNGWPLAQVGEDLVRIDPETGEVSEPLGPERAARFASLLLRVAQTDNQLVGILDGGEAGTYQGGMAAHKYSLRLDPNWTEVLARRSRGVALKAWRQMIATLPKKERQLRTVKLRNGKRSCHRLTEKHLVLTMPDRPGTGTYDQICVFNEAFRALTKTYLWSKAVWAGIKGVEDALDPFGPHVHGHFLLLSRWMDKEAWRAAWTDALDFAWRKHYKQGLSACHRPGQSKQIIIDIQAVKPKIRPGHERPDSIAFADAIFEVTKYVTKPADFLKPDKATGRMISSSTLLELCEIGRWPRMFELLGKARQAAKPVLLPAGTRLDTSCISAATEVLRDLLTQAKEPEELEDEWDLLTSSREKSEGPAQEWDRYLPDPPKDPDKRARPPSWRVLMDTMALGPWLRVVTDRAARGIAFRLNWIAEHNPTCCLVDMAGNLRLRQAPDLERA